MILGAKLLFKQVLLGRYFHLTGLVFVPLLVPFPQSSELSSAEMLSFHIFTCTNAHKFLRFGTEQ